MTSTELSPKSIQTRAHILATALKLFAERGYEQTTMRAISKESELSLGASYYHFTSKDQIILAYYQATAHAAELASEDVFGSSTKFSKRMESLFCFKFEQLQEQRTLIKILARHGSDFSHPLSPFSTESKPIRDSAIAQVAKALEGSSLRFPKKLRNHLPMMLWLYQMGLILFWANDSSADQQRTFTLMTKSLALIERLLSLAALPLVNKVHTQIIELISLVTTADEDLVSQSKASRK